MLFGTIPKNSQKNLEPVSTAPQENVSLLLQQGCFHLIIMIMKIIFYAHLAS